MKKTIAKLMAAAMLLASVPAVTLPATVAKAETTFSTVSITTVKFTGSYEQNKIYSRNPEDTTERNSTKNLMLDSSFDMSTTGNGVWTTNIQYQAGWDPAKLTTNGVASKELKGGGVSIKSEPDNLDDVKDYYDETGTVKKIETNSDGKLVITLDTTKFTTAKIQQLAKGDNNLIEFTPWKIERVKKEGGIIVEEELTAPVFTIQVGKVYVEGKTQVDNCSTDDGFIKNATVQINKDNLTATLIKVSETDKKVNMKGQKIDVSSIEVGGISYDITKLEEQCLKKGKMKKVTAKKVKNVMTGALRNCKKLRQVNMGSTKIKRIHSNAFYDCEKLRNIKIKCHNLKAVGHYAFKKLKKNCTISIKAGGTKKYNEVVKMIKKSGVDQVKFKKA